MMKEQSDLWKAIVIMAFECLQILQKPGFLGK